MWRCAQKNVHSATFIRSHSARGVAIWAECRLREGRGQGCGEGSAFGEGEGHFFYGQEGGDVEGEELAAVHDGLQAAEGGFGGGGGGELAQGGGVVGEFDVGVQLHHQDVPVEQGQLE